MGQTAAGSPAAGAAGTSASTSTSGGSVVVPPEKAVPQMVPKAASPIVIDGRPDEAAWQSARVLKDFYQTSPGYNTAPSKPTEVRLLYDDKNLYVAFRCWDDRDQIRSTVAKRDNVFNEDNVRFWLDTFDDKRRAYVLGFNPLGIQQDGIFTEDNGADFSVDIVMESKGVIEDWGWSVEVRVPFSSLRYTAGKGKYWGFNAARNIDRFNDEFDTWLPEDRNVNGMLTKHGRIGGFDEISYERTIEIVPTITVSQSGERVRARELASGRFVDHPIKGDVGVTLKYLMTPNITLDAAINPDFAEIEADAPVVTANQRFPIFFAEKRPFFLEGQDIFKTELQPFHSRTIVDPDLAGKLTGKLGRTSFGLLAASDKAPGNYSEDERTRFRQCNERTGGICPAGEFIGKSAYFGIARLKTDIGRTDNIGLIGTARIFPRDRNFVGGIDGGFKLNPQTEMGFQVLGSHSIKDFYDPNTDSERYRAGNGLSYQFWTVWSTETHGWEINVDGTSRDYRADAGFTERTNTNRVSFDHRISTKSKPDATFIRLNFSQWVGHRFDWKGRPQHTWSGVNLNGPVQGNAYFRLEGGLEYETIYEEEFGAKRNPAAGIEGAFFGSPTRSSWNPWVSGGFDKRFNKKISIGLSTSADWGSFDYDFGAGPRFPRRSPAFLGYANSVPYREYEQLLSQYWMHPDLIPRPSPPPGMPRQDPGRSRGFGLGVFVEYRPTEPMQLTFSYNKRRLVRHDTGKVAFDSNIFSLRGTYQFTRFTFVRTRIDHDTLSSRTAAQLLFGWSPSPGKAFYVGYNDALNYNGFNPYTGAAERGFARNGRTFFVRASYLFKKSF